MGNGEWALPISSTSPGRLVWIGSIFHGLTITIHGLNRHFANNITLPDKILFVFDINFFYSITRNISRNNHREFPKNK